MSLVAGGVPPEADTCPRPLANRPGANVRRGSAPARPVPVWKRHTESRRRRGRRAGPRGSTMAAGRNRAVGTAQRDDAVSSPGSVAAGFADPGPLGLAGFAGTTFYLSAVNA